MPENTDADEAIDVLIDSAEAAVEEADAGGHGDEEILDLLEDLLEVADETEDVLSTIDLPRLATVIRWENLPDAVDPDGIEEAIESRDLTEVVDVRKLIQLSDLSEIWASADTREAWREKRELEEAVDDATDSLDDVTDDEDAAGADGPDADGDEGGFTEKAKDVAESAGDFAGDDGEAGPAGDEDDGGLAGDAGFGSLDPETVENSVQKGVSDAIGEFRGSLIEAHHRFREIQRENQERFDRRRTEWSGTGSSRNPTAVSTLPDHPAGQGAPTLTSTVPEETKYSSAPNRRRIYGPRWETARGDDDE